MQTKATVTKTTIINFYGGPGTGKSTSAAQLYAMAKTRGINAELVREYVKDWAWDSRKISMYDQFYFMGKQIRRESMLFGKARLVITDSPVLQGVYYAETYLPLMMAHGVAAATLAYYAQCRADQNRHVHVFLNRSKPYSSDGRFQTEDEARKIDVGVEKLFKKYGFISRKCETTEESLSQLLNDVMVESLAAEQKFLPE